MGSISRLAFCLIVQEKVYTMARTMYSFTNEVFWKTNLASWRNIKKESIELGRALGRTANLGSDDAHIKAFRKRNQEQEKFAELQEKVIRRFSIANKDIREMSESSRQGLIDRLKEQKTVKDLLFMERKLKTEVQDEVRAQKVRTREKEKQLLVQRRLTASTEQMVGALASVYTAAAAGRAIMDVGTQFEAIEKSFIVVSGGAEGAAEDFKFVREEAMRLGAPLTTLAENFARMRAAAGDKMALEDLQQIFIGVNESATALGLNQEKVSKIMLATQQMMSKNKIMAEELTGQMGESLSFALRAMASAAAEAGLIDGTMSQQKQEAALRKLMENGKAIASEILPHFGKELQKLARANDGLAKALEDNFNPSLMRAKNTLTELMNTMWENGMKQAFTAITDSFTILGQESGTLAKTLSSFLGGAIMGLTFPVNLLLAGIGDLVSIIKDLTGTTDENFDSMLQWTSSILGAVAGFFALYKAISLVTNGLRTITSVGKVATETVSKVAGTTEKAGQTSAMYKGSWDSMQKVGSGTSISSKVGGFLGKIGGPLAAISGFMAAGDRLGSTNERNQNIVDYITKGKRSFSNVPEKQTIEVKVGVDGNGNITPYIMSKIDEAQEQQLIDFYQNISPMN